MTEPPIAAGDLPAEVDCASCGDAVEAGYVPVSGERPVTEAAVCRECGWNEVGMMGCAPTLSDFEVDAELTALVRVERGEAGLVPDAVTDQ